MSILRLGQSLAFRLVAIAMIAALIGLVSMPAQAQELTIDLGDDASLATRIIQLFVLVTVLSLVPGLAIMITCFPFLVTVLAILRQGIGLQQSPPNMLIVSLALFLTYFVMQPVFAEAWNTAAVPLADGSLAVNDALQRGLKPFAEFMTRRVDPDTLRSMLALRPDLADRSMDQPTLDVLIPSFLLSEISKAFQIGFLIFLPFLIIDLVVAAILMSMGMVMVPPAIVSLPFKLAFFVVVDGWTLISTALVRSYM